MKELITEIRQLIQAARSQAAHTVDFIQVLTCFEIGRRLVNREQQGKERAQYGKALLINLSQTLTAEFGRGFSRSNLQNMRKFYLTYADRLPEKGQSPSGELPANEKCQTPSGKSTALIWRFPLQTPHEEAPFRLSWSQYVFLITIDDPNERSFYEIEAAESGWTLPELKRQYNSGLFERLALSRDKEGIRELARRGQLVTRPEDLLKEPYVLEFLGLDEKERYSESDLESAIIDKLEHFLLELGKGFLFEARQKRLTFDEEHFFVDLVFYNRLLRCYVLIDLKIGKLSHRDLGQMQMYVNYFDRFVKQEDERPSVGIVLCKKKHDTLVEITLPEESNIHAREYRLYLPDRELLQRKLKEWSAEAEKHAPEIRDGGEA